MGGGRVPLAFRWMILSPRRVGLKDGRAGKGSCPKTGSNAGRCDDERICEVFHDRLLRSESVTKEGEVSGVLMKLRCQ